MFTSNRIKLHHSQFYTTVLSVRQLLFDVIVIINPITQNYLIVHLIMQVIFNQTLVCDTILIDGNYPQHNISLVTLMLSSDLCKENDYCKTVSLYAC